MIAATDFGRLAPSDKAALIYAQAKGDVATRLWRAALGSGDRRDGEGTASFAADGGDFTIDSLLALAMPKTAATLPTASTPPIAAGLGAPTPAVQDPAPSMPAFVTTLVGGLGPNARYGQALVTAAARTGMPAAALAAIVDAEAGKGGDGSWKTASRNPRSSAAGLGQFLGGTWQSEAERAGTWLHGIASSQGWLGGDGRVLATARSTLLALRYDATASINATADYASRSVTQLKHAGIAIGEDLTTIARAAYLGHHLGTADAVRFLKGGLDNGRARLLLDAQVGSAAASQRIARSTDAASAHRSWLLDFIDRHVTPSRFGTLG